jgi:hypothetical protein
VGLPNVGVGRHTYEAGWVISDPLLRHEGSGGEVSRITGAFSRTSCFVLPRSGYPGRVIADRRQEIVPRGQPGKPLAERQERRDEKSRRKVRWEVHRREARKNSAPAVRGRARGIATACTSSRGGTRTPDPVINSHLLYQLSYSGKTRLGHQRRGVKLVGRADRSRWPSAFPPSPDSLAIDASIRWCKLCVSECSLDKHGCGARALCPRKLCHHGNVSHC